MLIKTTTIVIIMIGKIGKQEELKTSCDNDDKKDRHNDNSNNYVHNANSGNNLTRVIMVVMNSLDNCTSHRNTRSHDNNINRSTTIIHIVVRIY